MEVECSVLWFSADVKEMEFISRAMFTVLDTLDIVFPKSTHQSNMLELLTKIILHCKIKKTGFTMLDVPL